MSEFTEIADEVLGDLLRKQGFLCVGKEHGQVIFESATCTLIAGHDSHRSNEVFIGLNRRDASRGPDFNFEEIIRAASVPAGLQPTGYAVRDEKAIRHLLQTMAALLAAYCVPLLRGDYSAWWKLESQRVADVTLYAMENHVRLALNRASEAWHAKDFAKVIEILGPVRAKLGASDRAKLEYAERRFRGD
jgi:hypothetical protein